MEYATIRKLAKTVAFIDIGFMGIVIVAQAVTLPDTIATLQTYRLQPYQWVSVSVLGILIFLFHYYLFALAVLLARNTSKDAVPKTAWKTANRWVELHLVLMVISVIGAVVSKAWVVAAGLVIIKGMMIYIIYHFSEQLKALIKLEVESLQEKEGFEV